jgi:hypothetical protein
MVLRADDMGILHLLVLFIHVVCELLSLFRGIGFGLAAQAV